MNKRQVGTSYEKIAAAYLEKNGYVVLEHNYRNKIGEIDIVAKDGEYLCFVEVKYRKTKYYGMAVEAVDYKKQKIIYKVAEIYLSSNRLSIETPCRFDVVAITGEDIELYKNAFEGD